MSINTNAIERDFKANVCEKVRIASEGSERYRVFTPFTFDDGDGLSIVLKKDGGGWVLSDEANTYMRLTYDMDEQDFSRGQRQLIIANALSMFQVEDRKGELVLAVPDAMYGDALFSFVQAILKIADVSYLSRERVRSTFMDDFRGLILDSAPKERVVFDWSDSRRDPQGVYSVDCRINGMERPLLVHALANDRKTQEATIALFRFKSWEMPFQPLAIFENQDTIGRKVLARLSDVCEDQFPSLYENQDGIQRFIHEAIASGDRD